MGFSLGLVTVWIAFTLGVGWVKTKVRYGLDRIKTEFSQGSE